VTVISNSSPLIALVRIERLELIPSILGSIVIPLAVAQEIRPSIPVLPDWVELKVPAGLLLDLRSRRRLGDGECEAIALAIELRADAILLDDRPARRLAEAGGLHVIGTLGLLLEAKRTSRIQSIRTELDRLLQTSFFLSQQLYDELLRMAGEEHSERR
jgi:predicted nucleic acid-binding protein